MKIKSLVQIIVAATMLFILVAVRQPASVAAGGTKILQFDTMVGVPQAYTAAQNRPIHGVNGGGRPWVISSAKGELFSGGKLELSFTGLVFDPNDPGVIAAGLANRNTVANMKAVVACYTSDGSIAHVSSPLFPVTTGFASEGGGSGSIETHLSLPQPCIAPVVFVTSPGGAWFAATGN